MPKVGSSPAQSLRIILGIQGKIGIEHRSNCMTWCVRCHGEEGWNRRANDENCVFHFCYLLSEYVNFGICTLLWNFVSPKSAEEMLFQSVDGSIWIDKCYEDRLLILDRKANNKKFKNTKTRGTRGQPFKLWKIKDRYKFAKTLSSLIVCWIL